MKGPAKCQKCDKIKKEKEFAVYKEECHPITLKIKKTLICKRCHSYEPNYWDTIGGPFNRTLLT